MATETVDGQTATGSKYAKLFLRLIAPRPILETPDLAKDGD